MSPTNLLTIILFIIANAGAIILFFVRLWAQVNQNHRDVNARIDTVEKGLQDDMRLLSQTTESHSKLDAQVFGSLNKDIDDNKARINALEYMAHEQARILERIDTNIQNIKDQLKNRGA